MPEELNELELELAVVRLYTVMPDFTSGTTIWFVLESTATECASLLSVGQVCIKVFRSQTVKGAITCCFVD